MAKLGTGIALLAFIIILGSIMYISQQRPTEPQTDLSLNYQQNSAITPPDESNLKAPEPTADIATTSAQQAKGATIKTSKGDITIELYPDVAPKTVANFVSKANRGFYNNLTFHRVEDWVIQGGDPVGNGTGGGKMPTEFNSKPYVVGSVGVARSSDPKVQNDAQFFITKTEASWLDNQYTNFGIVTEGMDVVEKMEIGDKILGITIAE